MTMLPSSRRLPKYRHYKPKDLAVVRLDGKDHSLGPYGSEASREKYRRLVAAWLARMPDRPESAPIHPSDFTPLPSIAELLLAYLRLADGYFRKIGRLTKEAEGMRLAIRPLRELYALTPVRDFGLRGLKAVRQVMIEAELCRNEINRRVSRIVRVFKWGVENELLSPEVHHRLKAVAGLRRGRSEAREWEPVRPVEQRWSRRSGPTSPGRSGR